MDWTALWLSLRLAAWTILFLLPVAVFMGRFLAYRAFRGRGLVEALVALPLVLPPTVFGFYLLIAFGANSPLGQAWRDAFGHTLAFSLEGLVVASVIFNLPFAVQPAQRGLRRSLSRSARRPPVADLRRCSPCGRSNCRWPGRG